MLLKIYLICKKKIKHLIKTNVQNSYLFLRLGKACTRVT